MRTAALAAAALVAFSAPAAQAFVGAGLHANPLVAASCDVSESQRLECGYLGIQQPECESRGCCWQPTGTAGTPWCFKSGSGNGGGGGGGSGSGSGDVCNVYGGNRRDCGYLGIQQGECEARSCCWRPSDDGSPWCFNSSDSSAGCQGYDLVSLDETRAGIDAVLALRKACNIHGTDIKSLRLSVRYETRERLRVRIGDADGKQWEVPQAVVPRPALDDDFESDSLDSGLAFKFTAEPFSFAVTRKADGVVLFDTSSPTADASSSTFLTPLTFEPQYLELSTRLPTNANIYGLGEVVRAYRLNPNKTLRTFWSLDTATPVDENVYGSHPFYMELRDGKAHGVLLLTSNGLDVEMRPGALTYKAIGGVLDFYFFSGPSPAAVVAQYTELVGRPHMIPYWALGFHQCKYGYRNIWEVETVVKKFKEANIPLETMWTDIDYMRGFRDFTLDPVNFPLAEVQRLVRELHASEQKYVLIIDPAIKVEKGYKAYDQGAALDVFVKNAQGKDFVGKVWPDLTVFPDFWHPRALGWWTDNIRDFISDVNIDGLWIDMNEAANFCNGECSSPSSGSTVRPDGRNLVRPPYAINNAGGRAPLATKTIDVDATHYGGVLEYDVHNTYGHMEAIATRKAMLQIRPSERPFVLSRSTFVGSGAHAGHWTGDNFANWDHLYYSITGTLSFQLFGIPYVGADLCGFIGDTTEELCARWMEVGAFFPFSRNHNTLGAAPQEPYLWPAVAAASRQYLNVRYALMPLYYTLFHQANKHGATVLRPLLFEFPEDPSVAAIDRQFLVGAGVLVSPVTRQGATSVDAYFPAGEWYDYFTHALAVSVPAGAAGVTKTLAAPLGFMPLHLRGGAIVPTQKAAYTVAASRRNNFQLLVPLDQSAAAAGELYLDDGVSVDVGSDYSLISFAAATKTAALASSARRVAKMMMMNTDGPAAAGASRLFSLTASGYFGFRSAVVIDTIQILGTAAPVGAIKLNGVALASSKAAYSAATRELTLSNLTVSPNEPFVLTFEC